jgi:glycosyltransferase involved in cell wall biosynthesis
MRLGLTVDSLSSNLTGIGRYTWELCSGLAQHPAIADLGYFRFNQWISDPECFILGDGRKSRLPGFIRQWQAQRGFQNRLVHGTNYFLPRMADSGVITVHDMSVLLHPETHPIARVRDFEREFVRSLERAMHVITDSEATRSELITHMGYPAEQVTAVHLGVSENFRPQDDNQLAEPLQRIFGEAIGEYILSVATFEPRKRIEAAITSHARFCDDTGRTIALVLVGAKGWGNEGLHELIEKEQARGRLIMLGYVAEADLPVLYAGARLFLYPSVYEGFGLPPIEAMASGVPTIVSDRSCLPEVTRGAAMMVNPDDTDALSGAIERGLDDDKWREAAIQAGLEVAAHYSWQRCIKETVNVYRRCSDGVS